MRFYRYIKQKDLKSWTEGGPVNLYKTTSYKRDNRSGIFTPDENAHKRLKGDLDYDSFNSVFKFHEHATVTLLNATFDRGDGSTPKKVDEYKQSSEEALVLCLCTNYDKFLLNAFGKDTCVQILDIAKLKKELDEQIGVRGEEGICEYTTTGDRNHFLKSTDDQWQCEYRLIWKGVEPQEVIIPEGVAAEVPFRP